MPKSNNKPAVEALNKELKSTESELGQVEQQLRETESGLYKLSVAFTDLKGKQTSLVEKKNNLRKAFDDLA